jgi:SAM-dependent methyltransferase
MGPAPPTGVETFRVPAEAYDRHVGRYSPQLAAGLVRLTGVVPGMRALDVGCGTGALTAALAEALGADAVAAVDPSESFAAACRARVPGADVRVAGAESLPFPAGAFDVVLSQLVLTFLDDLPGAMGEMVRVARAGGIVAAAVWDYAEGMDLLRGFWDAAVGLALEDAAELDEGSSMRPATCEDLRSVWEAAGLEDVATGDLHAAVGYASFDELWAPLEAGVGPAGAFCTALVEPLRRALRERVHAELGAPAGGFTLDARAWWVRGVTRGGAG